MSLFWKDDWDQCRVNLSQWWRRAGLAMCVLAPKGKPPGEVEKPERPADLSEAWLDPEYRFRRAKHEISRTYFGGEAFPYFDAHIGPGSLGMILGSQPQFAQTTVWYQPCISDPDDYGPIRFDPQSVWFEKHMAMLRHGRHRAEGRFLIGMPDLIENIDALAQLRGTEELLLDMVERPEWVEQRVAEINQAYFQVFDAMYDQVESFGGNAFSAFRIWGEGRTAKLQCDASAMFSPAMFERFVAPALREQCRWLDFSLYHLDGTQALHHLDHLLGIDELDAIQWTPQAGIEGAGHPRWYELYRRILSSGKAVQALSVAVDQVLPLIDAIGTKGVFIHTIAADEGTARELLARVESRR